MLTGLLRRTLFWSPRLVRVPLLGRDVYVLQGIDNIQSLLRNRLVSGFAAHGSILEHVFGLPRAAAAVYAREDSGEHREPRPGSAVEPHNRVDFLTKTSFTQLFSGASLAALLARFEANVTMRVCRLGVGADWVRWDDLMDLFHAEVTGAAVDALCGPYLLDRHRGFTKDLWALDHGVTSLLCRAPRFLALEAYASRERALAAVKDWRA